MSAPQLADSSTSSEWFRTVAEPAGAEKARSASQVSIPTDARRKRFVRLVTYTMGGLVAFTVLGLASFAWRRHSMQSALAAPVPVAPAAEAAPASKAAPEAEVAPAPAPEAVPAPAAVVAKPAKPVAAAKPAAATKRTAAAKPAKKAATSPFLGAAKPAAKATSSARKP